MEAMSVTGEKLLFEISTPGARAVDLPQSDVPHAELDPALASFTESGLPELGQLELCGTTRTSRTGTSPSTRTSTRSGRAR
jgi:hypothetical protein